MTRWTRRSPLQAAALAPLAGLSMLARAAWPERALRLIVPSAAQLAGEVN